MKIQYWFAIALLSTGLSAFAEQGEVAITIDDLPFVGSANNDPKKLQREADRFNQILQTLVDYNVPATGFIIAGSIERGQWQLLEAFKEAGFNLGNHTYSHRALAATPTDKYIADVDKADKILQRIMTTPKYFRYPYLSEGQGEKRQKMYDYLAAHNYTIAPVTIDSKDFRFNSELFAIPYRLRPQRLGQLKKRYLSYIWNQTLRAQAQAERAHLPNKQILLIHANLINSHFLGDIISMYQENGYRIISLQEAMDKKSPTGVGVPVAAAHSRYLKSLFLKQAKN